MVAGRVRAIAIVATAAVLGMCRSVYAETLPEAWGAALGEDARLAVAAAEVEAAGDRWAAARAARRPSLTVDASETRLDATPAVRAVLPAPFPFDAQLPLQQSSTLAYRGTVQLPLYTGGRLVALSRAAEAATAESQAGAAIARATLRLEVAEAYVAVLRAGRGVRVALAMQRALASHLQDATSLARAGAAARADVLAAGVALADADRQLSSAQALLTIAHATYSRRLSRPLDSPVDLDDIGAVLSPRPALAQLLERARSKRPELEALSAERTAFAAQATARRADLLPQLGLVGGYAYVENRYQAHEGLWSVGLAIRWAAFDGGIVRHEASALAARARAAGSGLAAAESDISLQVVAADAALVDADRRLSLTDVSVASAEESLRAARDRYVTGAGPAVELLDALARWTGAQRDRDAAVYDVVIGTLRLAYATGEL